MLEVFGEFYDVYYDRCLKMWAVSKKSSLEECRYADSKEMAYVYVGLWASEKVVNNG